MKTWLILICLLLVTTISAEGADRFHKKSNENYHVLSSLVPGVCPIKLSCANVDIDVLNISWKDVNISHPPKGYLIKWSALSNSISDAPIAGVEEMSSDSVSHLSQNVGTAAIPDLYQQAVYHAKVFPQTGGGLAVKCKIDALVSQGSDSIVMQPCLENGFNNIASPPPGWIFSGLSTYTTFSNYGNSAPSLKFDDSNDQLVTGVTGGGTATELAFWIKGQSANAQSALLVEGFDGSNWIRVDSLYNLPTSGTTVAYNASSSPVLVPGLNKFRFTYFKSVGNLAFDDLVVFCNSPCIPAHSIATVSPLLGPAGTLVTIEGIGFLNANQVSFGGVLSSNFSVLNDSTIVAELPDGALSDQIAIEVAGCEAFSSDIFTVLSQNDNCGSIASDLFISEVYDALSGSRGYIEVFNGTLGSITLNSYTLRVINNGTVNSDYQLSGTLASGDTYIMAVGGGPNSCSNFTPNIENSSPGFNGNDQIILLKNGNTLDNVPNPNSTLAGGTGGDSPGFSQIRNSTVTAPSTAYIPSQWTFSSTEDCAHLGIGPYQSNAPHITITTQPADLDCDTILIFSVAASFYPSQAGSNSHVWRYHRPGAVGWMTVSTLSASISDITVNGSGTNTITISGNTATLKDYQFYVELATSGSPQCKRSSHAAQYTYDTRDYYRTIAGGNWKSVSTWEMSDSETGPYLEVCQSPNHLNSKKITIRDGMTVTVNVQNTCPEVVIESGAILQTVPDKWLKFTETVSGAEFYVAGTWIDNGTSGNSTDFLSGATWALAPNGTIIKTDKSSTATYRTNYENTVATIPSSAHWIYRRLSNTSEVNTVATGMTYPNLIFENQGSQVWNMNTPFQALTGSGAMAILGDLSVGATGQEIIVYNNLTNASPIEVHGDLSIGAGSTITNASFNGTGAIGTGLELKGDFAISGLLDLSHGASAPSKGKLILSGAIDQIGSGGATVLAQHMSLNKAGGDILADLSFEITKSLTLTSGILELENELNIVDLKIDAITSGASNASFVDGWVRKTASSGTTFTFPVGNAGANGSFYQSARIFDHTATTTIEVRYFAEENANAGEYYDGQSNNPYDFQDIGNCDFWSVRKVSGANPRVALKFVNPDPEYCNQIAQASLLRFSVFNGFQWDEIFSAPLGDEIISDQAISEGVGSEYGDFVFSSNSFLNVLPVELISFDATERDNIVLTEWLTATEIDNDYFTIERSKDAVTFQSIGTVQGAGTYHGEKRYVFADDAPLVGISYYRLKQTDYDGHSDYSDVRAVIIRKNANFGITRLNIDDEILLIEYRADEGSVNVDVFDVLGKHVVQHNWFHYIGKDQLLIPLNLRSGVYLVRLSQADKKSVHRIVQP